MYSHSSSEPVNVQLMEMLFIKFKCQLFVFFLLFFYIHSQKGTTNNQALVW